MTMTVPFRRITLHFSQMGLTDGLTFTVKTSLKGGPLLQTVGDPTAR
jgi:hypothetical protein